MKKLYLLSLLAGALTFSNVKAQTNLTQAVDFTVTDVNGMVHNLFDILNNGQHVCIDFFFDTCGPCQVTSPYFKQTYNNFGCNNEEVFFIAVDVGDTDAEVIAYENTFLGGSPGYPAISGLDGGGNAVVSAYGIGAFPTYILIRPDQTIIEQDMWPISDATTFTTYFGNNALSPTPCVPLGINDPIENLNISVYPNPATEFVTVKSEIQAESYTVFNALGEVVLNGTFTDRKAGNGQIAISSLTDGVYVVELQFEMGTGKFRFVKH